MASAPNPSWLHSLRWRQVGPFRGGRVVAVAGDPVDPTVFYFGSTGGGVWKTDDAGLTWHNVSDGFFQTASVGALAVAASDPNVVYAGMGESCLRANVAHGDGVYRSTDAGRSWRHLGLEKTRHIARVRVHPHDPDLVYVAAFGHVYGPNAERGVFRSRDGGRTWEQVLFRSERAGCCDLAMDPTNPRILFAAFWEADRNPWSLTSGGPGSGLFKSTDGGDSWTEISDNTGLPGGLRGRYGVAISARAPQRIWTLVEHADQGGLYRSEDGGATWAHVSDDAEIRQRPFYFTHVIADPHDPDTVMVLALDLWRSIDGGRTYAKKCLPHGDHHDMWIDPSNPRRMISGSDGGASVSLNGGDSWSGLYGQPTAEMYHVVTDSQFPYRIYGAQQDNSTISLPSRSDHGAISIGSYHDVGGNESGYIAVRRDNPNIVYAGGYQGVITRHDLRTHQQRDISIWPDNPAGWGAEDLKYRFQWTFPLVLSPHDDDTLYAAANRVFRTRDEGSSWECISADLTRNDPKTLHASGGPITKDNCSPEYYGTIFALAESPARKGVLWAGSDDGLIHVSQDGGATWSNVTPPAGLMPDWAQISILEPSPHDAATLYVAATRYRMHDLRPYLLKTTDWGRTWQAIVAGIPEDVATRAIREDRVRRGLLFAGTEHGVYVSLDGGAAWQPLQRNLPVTPVHDLAVAGDELVACTHGRSFWVLDDLSPLRQLDQAARTRDLRLFRPRTALRLRTAEPSFRKGGPRVYAPLTDALTVTAQEQPHGKPVLLDAGENGPDGVLVHYWLPERPAGEVRLSFRDATGAIVREFSSEAAAGAEDDGKSISATASGQSERVPVEAGANRFIWNLRLPGAREVPGAIFWYGTLAGPMVLPGTYTVELSVNGQTQAESFEVAGDPRVEVAGEDLRRQFDLLVRIRDQVDAVHTGVLRLRAARERLRIWRRSPEVAEACAQLIAELDAVEDELIQWRAHALEDTLNFPVKLNNKLAYLADVVGSADAAPTRQSEELFLELASRSEGVLARLQRATGRGAAEVEAALRNLGIPLIQDIQER